MATMMSNFKRKRITFLQSIIVSHIIKLASVFPFSSFLLTEIDTFFVSEFCLVQWTVYHLNVSLFNQQLGGLKLYPSNILLILQK